MTSKMLLSIAITDEDERHLLEDIQTQGSRDAQGRKTGMISHMIEPCNARYFRRVSLLCSQECIVSSPHPELQTKALPWTRKAGPRKRLAL